MKNVLGWLILLGVVAIGGILILNRPPVPPTSQLAQIPAGTRCANRPASYTTTVTDYAFSDSVPATTQGSIGGGWGISWNAAGRTSIVTDDTAPVSPSNVLQWKYNSGGSSGSGVGDLSHSLSSVNQIYIAFAVKHDANFEFNSISNKLLYLEPGNLILQSKHFQDWYSFYNGAAGGTVGQPTVNTSITVGQWELVEILVDAGTDNVKVWINGQLRSNLSTPMAGGWNQVKLDSTWGGSTGPRTRDSYRWIDHVLIAIPGSGTVTPPPPPPPPPNSYPNKPTNFNTVITDMSMSQSVPAGSGSERSISGASGWSLIYDRVGGWTRMDDSTAPSYPGSVWQMKIPAGVCGSGIPWQGDGCDYGSIGRPLSSVSQIYISLRVKWDAQYEWHPISNKFIRLSPGIAP